MDAKTVEEGGRRGGRAPAKGEGPVAVVAAFFFFAFMASYYLLRPLRDAYGAERPSDLKFLFLGTFAVTVLVQPAFGALVSRYGRRRIAPYAYRTLGLVSLAFGALLATLEGAPLRAVQVTFFCWISAYVVIGVSLFWGLMADLLGKDRSLRLFGWIAIGGTLGAASGGAIVGFVSRWVPLLDDAPFAYSVLTLLMLEACVRLSRAVERRASRLPDGGSGASAPERRDDPIGGGVLDGFAHVARSPYLLGIGAYVLVYVVGNTLLYERASEIVGASYESSSDRAALFARIDFATNAITLLLQLLATRALLRRRAAGVAAALLAVPLVSTIGLVVVALSPTLAAIAVLTVARRSFEFGLSKPGRDALFTVVSAEDKYKSKQVLDSVVYRAGDASVLWAKYGLGSLGVGGTAVLLGAAGVSAVGCAIALLLGRGFGARDSLSPPASPPAGGAPASPRGA